MKKSYRLVSWWSKAVMTLMLNVGLWSASAQIVEKVADLNIAGGGPGGPLDRFTQIGTNLWFTTEKGGVFDPAGTISRYNLFTREVVVVASLQNSTGVSPESSLLVIGDEAFFTTKSGGTGGRGAISKINLTNGVVTALHYFPADSSGGATPRGGLTRIGDELWTMTSSGGTGSSPGRGTIVKYNLTNGLTTVVTHMDGTNTGWQPFDGFTAVGTNAWYFTTFSGGSTVGMPGLTLGAGTLGRLTFDELGNPSVSKVVDLAAGHLLFPGTEPTLVGTNSLYFGTTGPNTEPGAIIRYDIDTGTWTNLYSFFTSNSLAIGARPGYSGMVEFRGELFFINRLGGANASTPTTTAGTVVKYNIASNTVTKLADLSTATASPTSLGSASGFFGSGTLVEENGRHYIYYPLTAGGAYNNGTIIRIDLAAFRIKVAPEPGNQVRIFWDGGYPPFTVQQRTNLVEGAWENVVEGLADRFVVLPTTNSAAYYQVIGQP